ncbi:MAG: HlyD family secretion protein [Anaerolineae bacterium]
MAGGVILLLVALVACRDQVIPWQNDAVRDPLEASGIIYAEEIEISSEFGGRVANLPIFEGQRVAVGDPVVELDTAVIDAQIEVAEAMVAMAEAGLAQAEAGARPGQIAVAEAQQAQAEAGWRAAQQAITDTQTLIANPQDIDLQIAIAQGQLASAGYQLDEAVALKDLATDLKRQADAVWEQYGEGGRYRFPVTWEEVKGELPPKLEEILPEEPPEVPSEVEDGTYTFGDWELVVEDGDCQLYKWMEIHIPYEVGMAHIPWWQSWIGVNAASAEREGIESSLALLYDRRANPQELESALDEAQSSRAQLEAQMTMAEAQVAGLRAGASPEQVAALEARVAQARAGRDALLEQRAMMTLEAPRDGTVVSLIVRRGEVAAAGATLVTLADLDEVTLTVYVLESRIGEVQVGQPVTVTVDSFPGRAFLGEVSAISARAEFTPRNVATKEERVTLVFGVDVRLPNADGALKPGMPADAVFEVRLSHE